MKSLNLIASMLLVGCAATVNIAERGVQMTPDQIASASIRELCANYAANRTDEVRAELERRDVFSRDEWRRIKGGTQYVVKPGMREEFLWCAYGLPGEFGDVKQVDTPKGPGTRYHYVFPDSGSYDVVVVNGVILGASSQGSSETWIVVL